MKVLIENNKSERKQELRGLGKLFKTPETIIFYSVHVVVDFSEEERAILTEHSLWSAIVHTDYLKFAADEIAAAPSLSLAEGDVPWPIQSFAKGLYKSFPTAAEGNAFAEKLKSDIIPRIKKCIEEAKATGTGTSSTYEL
jgi:hypothetical protein